jgi:hypothetical protein
VQSAHLAFKQIIVNGLFCKQLLLWFNFLKQFFQIHFAAVEGVCVLTILTLVIHPIFLTSFLEDRLRAINKTYFLIKISIISIPSCTLLENFRFQKQKLNGKLSRPNLMISEISQIVWEQWMERMCKIKNHHIQVHTTTTTKKIVLY